MLDRQTTTTARRQSERCVVIYAAMEIIETDNGTGRAGESVIVPIAHCAEVIKPHLVKGDFGERVAVIKQSLCDTGDAYLLRHAGKGQRGP